MKQDVLGLHISSHESCETIVDTFIQLIREGGCKIVTYVNPYAYFIAERSTNYRTLLSQFDTILSDGIAVVLAARLLDISGITRISPDSTSLMPHLFRTCVAEGVPVFLIGGNSGVAERAAGILRESFPGLHFARTLPGYFQDQDETIRMIKESGAKLVVCGMGMPAQEAFMLALKKSEWSGLAVACGGYLDQLSGGLQYYPKWIDRLNLRFLYRLAREPHRLWRRYILEYRVFLLRLIKQLLKHRLGVVSKRP